VEIAKIYKLENRSGKTIKDLYYPKELKTYLLIGSRSTLISRVACWIDLYLQIMINMKNELEPRSKYLK
jgi:hypothetical protein